MRLPGVCIVCREPVWWSGKSWRQGTRKGVRHTCPSDREVCGVLMPVARERCARRPNHTTEHRSSYAMANQYRMHMGRERAA